MGRLDSFLSQSSQEYRRMKLGLHRMEAALAVLGHPERRFASVLIAGTNGKGSTARMVESVLRKAGHRAGLYTSPHLRRFHERIQVDGEEVGGAYLEKILQDWTEAGFLDEAGNWNLETERLTWFEKATVLAFEAFRRKGVGIAVLEVGLGGRMDATNSVQPLVSAVTSIGLDHTEILGTEWESVAREKAGVMRRERPLVLGPVDAEIAAAFRRWAEEGGAALVETPPVQGSSASFSTGSYENLSISLAGRHQLANAATALQVLLALRSAGFHWEEKDLREGLLAARNPGRLQWLPGAPALLLDGAHNPQALLALAEYLRERGGGPKPVFLLAMMREKEPEQALEILGPLAEHFVFTQVSQPRSLRLEDWRDLVKKLKLNGHFWAEPQAALQAAKELAGTEGCVVVTGSLYLVAEILADPKG